MHGMPLASQSAKPASKGRLVKKLLKRVIRKTGIERHHVAACRMCCERHALAAVGKSRKRWIGRILCYHSIGQEDWGINDVKPSQFRRHIEVALNAGYRFVPASEIVKTGGKEKDLAITFDDGLKTILTNAAPILKDYNIPWTFFPVSEWSDNRHHFDDNTVLTWQDIEALLAQGVEMGSHSATHPDFGRIELSQMVDELGGSRQLFEKRLGFAPETFAIPLGQSMNWRAESEKAARDAGYSVIYAQAEETRPPGTVARTFVTKFDGDRIFKSLLKGKFDRWEEWV
jgi:peptidoglycan/xylan/chitin deacetylase (PgdA/CDA1 family)